MTPVEITILVLQILNILFTLCISPLVSGFVEFTKRIEKSNCFGSSIELTKINEIVDVSRKATESVKELKTELSEQHIDVSKKIDGLLDVIKRKSQINSKELNDDSTLEINKVVHYL